PLSELASWRIGTLVVSLLAAVAAAAFILLAPAPRGFTPVPRRTPGQPGLASKLWTNLANIRLLALYAQGLLLMGGFVAVYNFLGFRLEAPPFLVPASLASLVFIAYLSGTWSSRQAGQLANRFGRLPALLGSIGVMAAGLAVTLAPTLLLVLLGLVLFTAGFFSAHAVASGWVPLIGRTGRAQSASLYNLAYYTGSSLFGWAVGLAFIPYGWGGAVVFVLVLQGLAAGLAALFLRASGARPARTAAAHGGGPHRGPGAPGARPHDPGARRPRPGGAHRRAPVPHGRHRDRRAPRAQRAGRCRAGNHGAADRRRPHGLPRLLHHARRGPLAGGQAVGPGPGRWARRAVAGPGVGPCAGRRRMDFRARPARLDGGGRAGAGIRAGLPALVHAGI